MFFFKKWEFGSFIKEREIADLIRPHSGRILDIACYTTNHSLWQRDW